MPGFVTGPVGVAEGATVEELDVLVGEFGPVVEVEEVDVGELVDVDEVVPVVEVEEVDVGELVEVVKVGLVVVDEVEVCVEELVDEELLQGTALQSGLYEVAS